MDKGWTYSQKESEVGVVLVLVENTSEDGWLSHRGRRNRIQVGDDCCCIGVYARANGQSGESGFGVKFEEGRLEVLSVNENDLFKFDVDVELSAEIRISAYVWYALYRNTHTAISATAAQTEWEKV
jgi:hypothetical protein